jgi:hypothetical protein
LGKEQRLEKIRELEKILNSKVICFLTTDRFNLPPPPQFISKDCAKILQQHVAIGEKFPKLSLFIVSYGGDMGVPWEIVKLLSGHCETLQAVIPYVCQSAATMIAIGCDERVVGARGQLSPTDPTLQVKTGAGADAPTISFGVEDINAFIEFAKNTLGRSFATHSHEALNKLIDRVQPDQLGSINRTYLRNILLIRKLLNLNRGTRHPNSRIEKIIRHLTVAYYAHGHTISRDEMRTDLDLPIIEAESLGCDKLIWDLYEDYASEFESRKLFDAQQEFQAATPNPLIKRVKGKYIESTKQTDVYVQTHTITGTGTPNFNFTVPQIQGTTADLVQQIFNHFMAEMQNQLKPLQTGKVTSTSGEWIRE